MTSSKSFFLLALWLSFNQCYLAEKTIYSISTPENQVEKDDEHLRFIIEFERNDAGQASKQTLMEISPLRNDEDGIIKIIRRIESRNVAVVQFRNSFIASQWHEKTGGIKYFEKGEMNE